MLEALVAPRIRRTLLEYLLTHPTDRFYLRGLAKGLDLPVSPLRRELKRLERAQMLSAVPEGNMLFYTVKTASPAFLQLQRMGTPSPATAPERVRSAEFGVRSEPLSDSAFRIPHSTLGWWGSPLSTPALMGATAVGMTLILIMAGLFYVTTTNRRVASQISRVLSTRKAEVTVGAPSSAAGAMRGAKWQVLPGGFGGFSSGASNESY